MEQFIELLHSQYAKCFKMLAETITCCNDQLWFDAQTYESPAWQVVYHALYYANVYCSPTQERIRHWPESKKNLHRFAGTSSALPKEAIDRSPYTKAEMLEFLEFVEQNVPEYLREIEPAQRCWPSWYDETQLEFHVNNIRHIQHHIGQVNERQNNLEAFDYSWYGE